MRDGRHLELIDSQRQEDELIEKFIRDMSDGCRPLDILEAGCGREWPFQLDDVDHVLTGIDRDRAALDIRKNTVADLDESIEGDLCFIDLPANRYDVIYCSFVLEHIEQADLVIENFVKWVKPNGLIIIKIPDPYSVYGFITRTTPHWFHVFFYRFFLESTTAGKPGYPPYPTYYNPIVSRRGIRKFCENSSNKLTLDAEYGDGFLRPGTGAKKILIHAIKKIFNLLSLGTLSDRHTNLLYLLRKGNTQEGK